jgi:hypothetical protein
MEITENILLERQRYLINLLIENTKKLNKVKNISIKHIMGKDESTDVYFNINFWENNDVKEEPTTFNAAFKEAMIKEADKNIKEFEEKYKPEAINFKSVLNFNSTEDIIAKEKKVIENYIEKIVKTEFAKAKEKVKPIHLLGLDWLGGVDEVTPEYIDNLHKQIIEKNKETSKNIGTKLNVETKLNKLDNDSKLKFYFLSCGDKKDEEYIDELLKQQKNKQNKVVLAIFDLSDMD